MEPDPGRLEDLSGDWSDTAQEGGAVDDKDGDGGEDGESGESDEEYEEEGSEENDDEGEVPASGAIPEGTTPSSLFDVASPPDVKTLDNLANEVESVLGDVNDTNETMEYVPVQKKTIDTNGWAMVHK